MTLGVADWSARETAAIAAYESRQRYLRETQAVDFPGTPLIGRDWSSLPNDVRQAWRDEVDNARLDRQGAWMTPPDEFRGT